MVADEHTSLLPIRTLSPNVLLGANWVPKFTKLNDVMICKAMCLIKSVLITTA